MASGGRFCPDIPSVEISLVRLYPHLEAVAVHGPGKHELVRMVNAYQRRAPKGEKFFLLTSNYGDVWVRPKDLDKVTEAILGTIQSDCDSAS